MNGNRFLRSCVGAEWKPSNVGLDDVVLDNCCWGAKTVFGATNIEKQQTVRIDFREKFSNLQLWGR